MSFAVPSNAHGPSLRNILTATLGATALIKGVNTASAAGDAYAGPVPRGLLRPSDAGPKLSLVQATVTITVNPGPTSTAASKAQLSQLANAHVNPAFNVEGVSATMQTPPSFSLYPAGDPAPIDVDQTTLGDCYFDAVMGALAQQGPKAVKTLFSGGKNGVYTVKMYDLAGNAVSVQLNDQLPYTSSGKMVGASGPSMQPNWASLAEKAYAKYNDVFQTVSNTSGYSGIADGGDPGAVLRAFTGQNVTYDWHTRYVTAAQRTAFAQALRAALQHGQPAAVASNDTYTLPSGAQIVGGHAYTIMQVDETGGDWFIDVRNPWGFTDNVKGSSQSTDDGVLRMGFGDYVDMLVLTYYPDKGITDADDSDRYDPPQGQAPVNGGDAGMRSAATRVRPLAWGAVAGAALFVAPML